MIEATVQGNYPKIFIALYKNYTTFSAELPNCFLEESDVTKFVAEHIYNNSIDGEYLFKYTLAKNVFKKL